MQSSIQDVAYWHKVNLCVISLTQNRRTRNGGLDVLSS